MYSYPFLQCLYVFYWVTLLSTGFLGYLLLRQPPSKRLSFLSFTVFCLSSLALVAYKVSDGYTGAGLNEATVYQLNYGLSGLEDEMKGPLIFAGCGFFLFLVVFGLVLWFRIKKTSFTPQKSKSNNLVLFPLLAVSIFLNPGLIQSSILLNKMRTAHLVKKDIVPFVLQPPETKDSSEKNPVVYIYLESFEGTFLNQDLFPGLTPNLYALSQEGVSIHGIREVAFTGWTIAGQMASNCGFPGMKNTQHSYPCAADFLSQRGYSQVYMNGASMDFAGQGGFWRDRGYKEVLGNKEIRTTWLDLPKSKWGVYDDDFFAAALVKYRDMKKHNKAFVLTLLTLDTHGPSGFKTPSCQQDVPYAKIPKAQEILSAVHCTDRLVGEFVRKIRNEDPQTIIVIQSDHFQKDSADVAPFLKEHASSRENLFLALGPNIPKKVINRSATMFDVAPTFLTLLGFPVPHLNLGRNLLLPQKTLAEEKGYPWMNEKMDAFLFSEQVTFYKRRRLEKTDSAQ